MTQRFTNLTSDLIDPKKIKSTDLADINISPEFKDQYKLNDFDISILKESVMFNSGMTDFQSKYFVAGSQITPWKQVRQCLMELEVRYHAYFEITHSLRKAEIYRKQFLKALELEKDELQKELIQIDMEKNDYDITIWRRKLKQSEIEINSFLNIVKEHVQDIKDLEYFTNFNEEEERDYWVLRLAKQAALDIIAYGRIGSGNMDSIAMMKYEDQAKTIETAIKYSGMINANVSSIADGVTQEVMNLMESGKLEIPLLQESNDVQRSTKPKITGERIQ